MRLYENGEFISCEDENRTFKVLIEDQGKIVFTGDRLPDEYAGIKQRVDLGGKCVVPAFADSHLHFASFSLFLSTPDVRTVRDFNEMGDVINMYRRNNPQEKLILGFGCSAHIVKEKRLPNRADLDKITTLPLLLVKYDGHAAVANTALLAKFPDAVQKSPGFDRETGWLYHQAFYDGVNYITGSVSPFTLLKNLINGADYLARRGIGLVHTVEGVGFPRDIDVDMMRVSIYGLPQTFRIYFQTMIVDKVQKRKMPRIGGCFATALDGCFGSEDAALSQPYSNNKNNKGVLVYSQQTVSDFVKRANRQELQVAMHAIGDAAVEQAVVAYEEALTDYPRSDHRHIIIHADLIPPPLLERAAKLGLHFAVQTPFLHWEQEPSDYLAEILGQRVNDLIPLRNMIKHGLTIAGGSDAPCTLPDPVQGIFAACQHPNPEQRISVLDALRMHTYWPARLSFDEAARGTLTKGKMADFVVLDKNPLQVTPARLAEIRVVDLFLKGQKYMGPPANSLGLLLEAAKNKFISR
ncbi:amidohydrolase [Desulfosporosinus burensis]